MNKTFIRNASVTLVSVMAWFIATIASAQTAVTVEQAGTLSSVLPNTEKSIKVTGPLNGTDFKYLRDMVVNRALSSIDLSDARVVSGGEAYYDGYKTSNDEIGEGMFYECKKLTSIVLPSGITSIGNIAFSGTGLKKVEIPNQVTNIGNDAFAYCSSLATVVLGKKVTRMEQGVFYSSAVTHAYMKPLTPPNAPAYMFSSNPRIHVYSNVLADYKATEIKGYGTLVGDLEKTYPYEKDPDELAADKFASCFEDVLCTQLKAEYAAMSDEALAARFTEEEIPASYTDIALKIKNDKWAAYEKDFRIHAYKAYSDASYWNDKMKSTGGSYMGNPTGIYVKDAENLIVFVGDDIPSGATLYLAGCVENDLITNAQTGKKLSKGVNIVPGKKDALYYVVYTADTKQKTKKLSEWPLMNIHIEGGVVNGYYELSRHSDADYKAILRAATHKRFTVKGDESLFHFKTATFRKVWPSTIDKSICWFDSLTVWQKELMGFCETVALGQRDFYPHNLSGGEAIFPIYYNNPNFAIEGEAADAGWANATPYRTSYNSVDCIRSTFDLEHTSTLDDWCAGHECGHQNQSTVSLEGCTEVSNNLFANMVRFIDGLVTSTGTTTATTMSGYAQHTPFFFRSVNERIHMYHQLYLYFHQARRNTAFFPTLFMELRKSPMTLYQSTNNNGALKFVRLACKVAQQDLSDFFRAYGLFEAGRFEIEDYGDHVITVRQTDINRTLTEIAQYPKNREILFIEDRITDVLSTGFPAEPGQKRRESDKIGQCGDVGQFTDYLNPPAEPSCYSYAHSDSLYLMSGTGGVGFIVLDSQDQMLYASNSRTFILPASVGTDFSIYSMDCDGTLHPCEENGECYQKVAVQRAGVLSDTLVSTMVGAAVEGPINGTDLKYLRQMIREQNLIMLDLSKATIRSGGLAYYNSLRSATNVLGESMFYGFKKLQYLVLPQTITRVGNNALARSGLHRIEIPNSVTNLDGDAFAYCENLTEVIIGEKLKTMAQGVFYDSPVRDVYVRALTPPSLTSYAFSSHPTIHVRKSALSKYKASAWADFGTIVGDLDEWEEANSILAINDDVMPLDYVLTGGQLTLNGLPEGTTVSAYTIGGIQVAQTMPVHGNAELDLAAYRGKVLVICVGKQHCKLYIRD